uniref:ABC transporter domain-containing protein n=1 Tax=Thermosporothrix sp. COM3 TaxID=2490863 RepID=A0A455SQR0_9CHLR|nr:hypothetical protein KTC_22250 [Thermosporothrix sp. COM3]
METERFQLTSENSAEHPHPSTVTVTASQVNKSFRLKGQTVQAVNDVSFAFSQGQFIAILGPSGSGKSTLLHLLGGLDRPDSGELVIDGVDITRLSSAQEHRFRRTKLGFVFQSFHLIASLTAFENVALPMELKGGVSREAMQQRARDLLKLVGIDEERFHHTPGRLSGGQQQRVAIARALANDPAVILADEPTGNLDSQTGRLIVHLLKELTGQGKTVIVVTHDHTIAEIADVRLNMRDGRLIPPSLS